MRLSEVINSRLICAARLVSNERVTNALITSVSLTRTFVNMSSQDGKPPIGAILVNVPAASSTSNSDSLDRQKDQDCTRIKMVNEVCETRLQESSVTTACTSTSAQISIKEVTKRTNDHLKPKQSMDIPVRSKVAGRKSDGSKSQKQFHVGLDSSSRNDDKQTSDIVVKSQKRKVPVKKKSILPKSLLENVTDFVRQHKANSSDNAISVSGTHKSETHQKYENEQSSTRFSESQQCKQAFSLVDKKIPAIEDNPEKLSMTSVEEMSKEEVETIKINPMELTIAEQTSCSELDGDKQSMEAEGDADLTCDTLMDSSTEVVVDTEVNNTNTDEVSQSGDELLFPDLIEEPSFNMKTEEDVFDISPLFTGELDRRYKREKKKAGKWKGKKNKGKKKDKQGDSAGEHEDGKAEKKLLPNYFVAIQITNKKIHEAVQKVQEEVLKEESLLSSAMIKLAKLHLTLMVLRIDTEEDMVRSKQAMDNAMDKLLSVYSNKTLTFDLCGIANFRNEIVFAKIKDETQVAEVKTIADIVEDCFLTQDMISPDKHGFKPHVTVMKLSKAKHLRKKERYEDSKSLRLVHAQDLIFLDKQGFKLHVTAMKRSKAKQLGEKSVNHCIKKIDEKLYKDFLTTEFGIEHVTKLQLCNMLKTDSTGYYLVEHEVLFPSGKVSVNDSGFEESSFTDKEEPNGREVTDTSADEHKENTGELMESIVDIETSESCRMTHTSDVLGEKMELSEKCEPNGTNITGTPEDEHKENKGELMESTVDIETSESCRMTHTSDALGEKTEHSEKSEDTDIMEDSPEVPSTLSEDMTHVK